MTEEATKTLPVTNPTEGEEGNEALIAEMLATAQPAHVPTASEQDENRVIHQGDVTQPAPMVATKVTSAGHLYVYDRKTHERFAVLYYMMPQILRQKNKDGSLRFTTNVPTEKPTRGTFKCILHAEAPLRPYFTELGLPICPKSNMWNRHGVTLHMKKKHSREWDTIEEERKETDRLEDREERRANTAALLALARGGEAVATQEAEEETPPEAVIPEHPDEDELFQCAKCDLPPFPTQAGLDKHMEKKHKE